jgi:hypothetical protein
VTSSHTEQTSLPSLYDVGDVNCSLLAAAVELLSNNGRIDRLEDVDIVVVVWKSCG